MMIGVVMSKFIRIKWIRRGPCEGAPRVMRNLLKAMREGSTGMIAIFRGRSVFSGVYVALISLWCVLGQ